jgi:hypothetical protein
MKKISERNLRSLIREAILFSQESVLGKKFSFEDDGEPAFVVLAEKDSENGGPKIIARYSKFTGNFDQNVKALSGYRAIGENPNLELEDLGLLNQVRNSSDGWKVSSFLKEKLDAMFKSDEIEIPIPIFIIDSDYSNFKKPVRVSTESGREKFSKFECTLKPAEAVKKLINYPNEDDFMESAACFYYYANSGETALLSAAVGAAIGLMFGGIGAIPGLFGGLAIGDTILRLPPFVWALANKKWHFAAANGLILAFNLASLGVGSAIAKLGIKSPAMIAALTSRFPSTFKKGANVSLGIAKVALELLGPVFADSSIQIDKDDDEIAQAMADIIDEKLDLKQLLDQSEKELFAKIKQKYPDV